jgi:hypothetical protein
MEVANTLLYEMAMRPLMSLDRLTKRRPDGRCFVSLLSKLKAPEKSLPCCRLLASLL